MIKYQQNKIKILAGINFIGSASFEGLTKKLSVLGFIQARIR